MYQKISQRSFLIFTSLVLVTTVFFAISVNKSIPTTTTPLTSTDSIRQIMYKPQPDWDIYTIYLVDGTSSLTFSYPTDFKLVSPFKYTNADFLNSRDGKSSIVYSWNQFKNPEQLDIRQWYAKEISHTELFIDAQKRDVELETVLVNGKILVVDPTMSAEGIFAINVYFSEKKEIYLLSVLTDTKKYKTEIVAYQRARDLLNQILPTIKFTK